MGCLLSLIWRGGFTVGLGRKHQRTMQNHLDASPEVSIERGYATLVSLIARLLSGSTQILMGKRSAKSRSV